MNEAAPMEMRLQAHRQGQPLTLGALEQVHATIDGRGVTFCLNMSRDPIQNLHRRGAFYEAEELALLASLLPKDAVVLDVGANVGNHALWLAMFGGARQIVVIEPNPLAIEPLVANVLVNRLERVIDISHLGYGLSDRDEGGFFMKKHDRNLGATKMFANGGGDLTVRRGDDAFPDLMPHLVKIDVEGMELQVLAGLEGMIARAKPVLMVEVGEENLAGFAEWLDAHPYTEHRTFALGERVANHILVPEAG